VARRVGRADCRADHLYQGKGAMEKAFFDGWGPLARIVVVAPLAYAAMIAALRAGGKRTLAKMDAFDMVVTVSLGSILATVVLDKRTSLSEGVLAVAVLIGLQFVVTWLSTRLRWFRDIVTGEPTMMAYRGQLLGGAMRRARVTAEEVRAAVRAQGLPSLEEAESVVLETDGSFSVVRRPEGGAPSLSDVERPEDGPPRGGGQ
jgi:uncharacterized membrane protein YcaP (DUF421 family)